MFTIQGGVDLRSMNHKGFLLLNFPHLPLFLKEKARTLLAMKHADAQNLHDNVYLFIYKALSQDCSSAC